MWLAPSADEAESAAFVKSEAPAMKKSRKKKSSPPTVGFYTATRFQLCTQAHDLLFFKFFLKMLFLSGQFKYRRYSFVSVAFNTLPGDKLLLLFMICK